MIAPQTKAFYDEHGYAVARGLFSPEEVAQLRDHFMQLRAMGTYPGDMVADVTRRNDPLQKYPRMIHMHRWDETTLRWLLDARLAEHLTEFLGHEPYAVQSMIYFKPPGARGQAVHQDNFYLRAKPGTCMAAWLALDRCDDQNGCMRVVPGSHTWPILCSIEADADASFTNVTVPLPEMYDTVPVEMEPGDVMFFNGSLVHGSNPNTTEDRFRRSLIGHYIDGRAQQVTKFDQPVLKMDGTALELADAAQGAPCGVWTDRDGTPSIELRGLEAATIPSHE
jgi:ectoine hydroxylase-related dioxygenase (phytanoyl-CoA dioxygenase family)